MDELRRLRELSGLVGLFESDEVEINDDLPVGKHNHIPDEDFDSEQLEIGIRVEYEHTDDEAIAKAIAKDHLSEREDYYILLAQVMGYEDNSEESEESEDELEFSDDDVNIESNEDEESEDKD